MPHLGRAEIFALPQPPARAKKSADLYLSNIGVRGYRLSCTFKNYITPPLHSHILTRHGKH
jgi:hypothetical protein